MGGSTGTPKLRMSPAGDHSPVGRTAGAIIGVVSVVALALAIFLSNPSAPTTSGTGTSSGATASSVTPTGHTTRVSVGVEGMAFTPGHLEVPVGDRLIIDFTNTGDQRHDLVFETGVSSGSLASGETKELDLGVISGDVEGWCSLPGHREMGMTLHVQATGASSSSGASASDGHAGHNHGEDATGGPATATELTDYAASIDTRDPALAPATNETERYYTFTVTEQTTNVTDTLTRQTWTFNGEAPGPILRGHIGDTFHITLVNNGTMSHSLDFHAGMVSPDNTMKTIAPGERLVYRFEAKAAGMWLYHCSTAPLSLHMTQGMYGAVIIDPADLDPVDHEYVMVQGEAYLHDTGKTASDGNKLAENSPDLIAAGTPTLTMFNGHATQYKAKPLQVKKGERVRIWVMAAGPNHGTSFHVVGSQFDTVYKEGGYLLRRGADAYGSRDGHSQALDLAPAQGGFVEMQFLESGTYTFVNPSFSEMERGAAGKIVVTDR